MTNIYWTRKKFFYSAIWCLWGNNISKRSQILFPAFYITMNFWCNNVGQTFLSAFSVIFLHLDMVGTYLLDRLCASLTKTHSKGFSFPLIYLLSLAISKTVFTWRMLFSFTVSYSLRLHSGVNIFVITKLVLVSFFNPNTHLTFAASHNE